MRVSRTSASAPTRSRGWRRGSRSDTKERLMTFEFPEKVKQLQHRLSAFMDEHIYPNEARYHEHTSGPNRWQPVPVIEELKPKARAAGLWNLFLPESEWGAGLTNLAYAPLCEIMGL